MWAKITSYVLAPTYLGHYSNTVSVPGKHPLPDKHPCTSFQGVNVAASIQMYGNYVPGKRPWALTRDIKVTLSDIDS